MTEPTETPTAAIPVAAPYMKPLPEPTDVTRPFWEAAKRHQLLIQRSKQTGKYVFYPRAVSPFAPGDVLEWVAVSGRASVYSYTVARRATAPQWAGDEPYVIAIVELEEGPHLTANILGCPPGDVHIGMPLQVSFEEVTPDVTLVQFRPRATEPPLPGAAGAPG